ncbi:MAG TPA: ABC transporter substrate-binding protein [Candidatus Limnocylindrales bacterium]|nr:ABC transporter substrate-binding protein [Candidatus Limnocylindrales bacterium]
MSRKFSANLAAGVVVSLVLAACGSQSTSPTGSSSGSGDGPEGELVTLSASLGGQGQDPMTQAALEWSHKPWWDDVHDFVIEQDAEGNVVPGLATEWGPSEDGLTWTFTIRDDVKFHNGDTLTAGDVAWSWNRLTFDPASTHQMIGRAPTIESISAEGNQVIIVTTTPLSDVPMWFAEHDGESAGAVYSEAYYEEVGDEMWTAPIGTGPYELVSLVGDESATLTAFLDDDRSDWQKERTPGFKDLTIRAAPDSSTRVALLRTGEADVAPLPISAVEELEGEGIEIIEVPAAVQSVMWCLGFSRNADSPCNDVGVREALSIAIDRQAIADSIYGGFAAPSAGYIAGPGTFGNPDDLAAPAYDPDRARELLAEAGYDESNPLVVEMVVADVPGDMPEMPTMAEAIAGAYQAVGIDATVRVGDEDANREALYGDEYNGQTAGDPALPVTLWMRGQDNRFYFVDSMIANGTDVGRIGTALWGDEAFPEITQEMSDRLLAVQAEFDTDAQAELLADFHRFMAENWLQIPLLTASGVFGVSEKVGDWDLRIAGKGFVHNQWSIQHAE